MLELSDARFELPEPSRMGRQSRLGLRPLTRQGHRHELHVPWRRLGGVGGERAPLGADAAAEHGEGAGHRLQAAVRVEVGLPRAQGPRPCATCLASAPGTATGPVPALSLGAGWRGRPVLAADLK